MSDVSWRGEREPTSPDQNRVQELAAVVREAHQPPRGVLKARDIWRIALAVAFGMVMFSAVLTNAVLGYIVARTEADYAFDALWASLGFFAILIALCVSAAWVLRFDD